MSRHMNARDIAVDLRRRITTAHYAKDERLPPERAMADTYSVARGTVREALKTLEDMGFVERRAGSGTYVIWSNTNETNSVIETTRPLELVDARYAIEPQMCRLAVLHATEQDLALAEAHLGVMEAGSDSRDFADIDERFHLALADAAHNPMIKWMMQRCHQVRAHAQWARMRTLTLTPTIIAKYNQQHRAIVNAIRARDPELAARAMREHLDTARRSLVEATM